MCVLMLLPVLSAWAQEATGTFTGTVKDSTGAVVPAAHIVVLNEDTGISRAVESDTAGSYTAPSLNPGNYRITATHEGFETVVRTGIVLTVGRHAVVDLSLPVGAIAQTVEVTGGAPLVETTTGSLGSLVDDRTIRALPLNGRSYDQLALLQPGVTLTSSGPPGNQSAINYGTGARFSVGGQRPNSNSFLLDGANINDMANGTPGGAAGNNLGVDTILEFRIFTNSFEAEYGHSMGSVITAVTRSGTNHLHATAYEYIRNSALDAMNYFDTGTRPPPFRRNQFGGVVGGPIRKDKAFFFAGYEGLRQGLGSTLFATVPTALARQGTLPTSNVTVNPAVVPYLALYPLPNGRDFGDGTAQYASSPTVVTNEDNVMGRLDYQLNQKTSLFGRYVYDNDFLDAPQSLPSIIRTSSRRQYATIQAKTIFGTKALNNFRFSFDRTATTLIFHYEPAPAASLSFIPGQDLGTLQLGTIGTANSRALTPLGPTLGQGANGWPFNVWQTGDDFSYSSGKHSFKAGFDGQRFIYNQTTGSNLLGTYTFPTFTAFLQAQPSNFQAASPLGAPFENRFRQWLFALYAEDSYKASSSLTLNLGLRWEASTNPTESSGKSSSLPSLASTSMVVSPYFFHVSKYNFEPRVGLAWQVTQNGKTVVRAGAGIYHNTLLPWFYQSISKNPPFSGTLSAANPPFPGGYALLKAGSSFTLAVPAAFQMTPTNYQYNVSIQQALSKSTVLQVAYAGSSAKHLETQEEGDTPIPTICSSALNNCPAGVANGQRYFPAGSTRRNTAWSGIRYYQTNGNSSYNAGTISLQRQKSGGFQGQVFYTYAKALDMSSGTSPAETVRSPQAILDPENPSRDWGLSDFSATNRAGFNFTVPIPVRKIKNPVLGAVANGWTANGIGTFVSGLPFTPLLSTSVSRNLASTLAERPNLNPGFSNNPIHGSSPGCTGFAAGTPVGNSRNWYDPCAFSLPVAGTYGNMGRNTVIGPRLQELDGALEKTFKVREPVNATFRAEMFNILNHPNFGLPNTTALVAAGTANAAAGQITYTITSSRQVQFALRISF
jgi:hypothetical protein